MKKVKLHFLCLIIILFFLVIGCGPSYSVRPTGKNTYDIETMGTNEWYERANAICPRGYNIITIYHRVSPNDLRNVPPGVTISGNIVGTVECK